MKSQRFGLYQPINQLKPVAENIWIVDGPIIHMAFPLSSIPFTTRMTIVRLNNGQLWIHSPTLLTETLKSEVDKLGTVRHLISSNMIHYAWIPQWAKAYPTATAWASPNVRDRAAKQRIDVSFDEDLSDSAPEAWGEEIEQMIFKGSRVLEEVVFFHKPSRTLILTDLIENFEKDKLPRGHYWFARLGGVADPDGKAPIDMRMTYLGRKKQARQSYERMMQWDMEKVIISHGRWYRENARVELERAFRWLR